MSDVTQSPFLQALGYAIINSLWQFALLWLLYVCVNTFFKLSSHQKYVAALLMQFSGFIWFTITFSFYLRKFSQFQEIYFPQHGSFSIALNQAYSSSLVERLFAVMKQTESLLPYLSIIYLLVLIFLGIKWITVYRTTQNIKSKGIQKIDISWRLFVKQLSLQLGIKREVKIFLSELVTTPLTIGFLKPLILIPLASLNHLNEYQMEALILHELAHIKRCDYLFNLFIAIVDITLFFNPFTMLISRHIRRERENCCDDWVLQYEYNPAVYATALLQIAKGSSSSRLSLGAADNTNILLGRIKRMIEKKESSLFNYRYQLFALLVMLTVAGALAILSSLHNKNKNSFSLSAKQVIVKPMAEIFNNPLFNPDFFIAPEEEKSVKVNELSPKRVITNNLLSDKSKVFKEREVVEVPNVVAGENKALAKLAAEPKEPRISKSPSEPARREILELPPVEEVRHIETSAFDLETAATAIEDQRGLLQEQLKQLIINLAEVKEGVVGQKELSAIKSAIEQLNKAQMKQDLSRQKISDSRQERNLARVDVLRMKRFLNQDKSNQLECLRHDFQLKIEKFKEQENKVNKQELFFKFNQRMPEIITQLPFVEKGHSFSFELSTDPQVNVVVPRFDLTPKKAKKSDKNDLDGENKRLNRANKFPELDRLLETNKNRVDNMVVIRI